MTNRARGSRHHFDSIPAIIGVSAVVLLFWSIGELVGLYFIDSPELFEARYAIGHVTIVPCCLGILYGMRWLRKSDLPNTHHVRIAVYGLVGGGGFLAFNIGLMTFFPTESVWLTTNWVRWSLSIGLAVGLLVGITQSRSIFNNIEAERQSLRAEHLEKQRDMVDHMNSILRHEVLNSTQVIVGNTELLMESDEPIEPSHESLGRIYRRGEDLSDVIQEVRSILHTMQEDGDLDRLDLSAVVLDEVQKIEDQHPNVAIETRIPDGVSVQGNGLLGRVFGNLLSNAAVHNDTGSLQIVVEAETGPDEVVTTVRDHGDGIPEDELDTLFDRPYQGDHGMGLYLVTELVESYGGTLELVNTGTEGTTFAVTLPLAERQQTGSSPRTDAVD